MASEDLLNGAPLSLTAEEVVQAELVIQPVRPLIRLRDQSDTRQAGSHQSR